MRRSRPQRTRKRQRVNRGNRAARIEKLESRQLMAADPLGATDLDTGEFFLGTVTVTPVFFESDGSSSDHTENWTEEEIDSALADIQESLDWWTTLLGTLTDKHELEFVIDDTYARDPFETTFEPISNTSETFQRYVSEFAVDQGLADSTSLNHAMLRFNDRQRNLPEHQTDWAFTIFMVDASEDSDGFFDRSGNFSGAFAYSGGLYVVTPNSRPASTIAHEIGHIFWARDEYPGGGSYTDRAGYYNSQNINAHDNPNLEQEPSIMRGGVPTIEAYEQGISSLRTLEFVGWRDSDGDGVFDLADVPLDLEVTGYFDAATSTYHVDGSATAVALMNQNSRSFQSDITTNRIDALQYRLDDGDWIVAQQYDAQATLIDLEIPITDDFDTIQLRVVDTIVNDEQQELLVTQSAIVSGTQTAPAISSGSLQGFAFIDDDQDGQRSSGEQLLSGTRAELLHADGSSLFGGSISASDYDGEVPSSISGVTLTAVGQQFNDQVYASSALENDDLNVFFARNFTFDRFEDDWGDSVALEAAFDQSVGEVDLSVLGLETGSYARIEAYDAAGVLLSRTTSERIEAGSVETISIHDELGRIASIRAFGHARTTIAISDLSFGFSDSVTTSVDGVWQFSNLVPGDYQVQIQAEKLIHQFDTDLLTVEATTSQPTTVPIAASVVDSPRHNVDLAYDADDNGSVTPADILTIINDLANKGTRTIEADEATGTSIDVSNDGEISPVDALLVINYLADGGASAPQGELIGNDNSTANHDQAISDMLGDDMNGSVNRGSNSTMLKSAGYTTGDESIGNVSTDSQRDTAVSAASSDSLRGSQSLVDTAIGQSEEQLTSKESIEASGLNPLRDGLDTVFTELK